MMHWSNNNGDTTMAVARVTEITASSKKSFEDAMKSGLHRATKTLKNVQSAWIASQEVVLKDGKITEYRVRMKVTFILAD
jgi:dodecin